MEQVILDDLAETVYTNFITAILSVNLLFIAFTDFFKRHIYVLNAVIISVFGAFFSANENGLSSFLLFLFFNLLILSIHLTGLMFYSKVLRKEKVSLLSMIGAGDIIFFASLTPFFSPVCFISFLLFSLIAIAVVYAVYFRITKRKTTIPLAGALSLCLLTVLLTVYFQADYSVLYNDFTVLAILWMR